MTTLVTILAEDYADWEIAPLAAVARGFYGLRVRHAAPGGRQLTSAAGLRVTPDLALDAIDLETTDALVVCGGTIWQTDRAPDLSGLLVAAHERGILVGGICDGTRALARAGLLDGVGHTSNSLDTLLETGYAGKMNYWDVPHAVMAERIVTAPGTAPVSFMAQMLEGLGLADANLDHYLALLAAEHAGHLPHGRPLASAAHAG
jgi:transcriptional regulator GlxA family with amidase domain